MGIRTKSSPDQRKLIEAELARLQAAESELKRRIAIEDPRSYGLPDLLRPREASETEEQFKKRQDDELRDFVQKLWVVKDGRKILIKLSPQMIEFLADMFYRREAQAILWKGRGTGGSLCTAILIWMCLVYHKMSFTSMAGSNEQAKQIYHYTKSFWNCWPQLARNLLIDDPLQGETRLTNGVILKIISASEKQARGKHNPGFIVDESCQEGDNTDRMISAAMQGAMSEPNFMIVLLSTFHHPIGLFQEAWDFAEERGFKRFNWNVYDSMEKCTAGMETATPEDPKALEFCRTQCPLTEKAVTTDDLGNATGFKFTGCCGKARDANGFLPRKNVIIAKKMNRGTNVFAVEYENERPNWMRPVYDAQWIENAQVPNDWPPPGTKILEKSAGIDWGLEGQTALILTALMDVPTFKPATPEERVGLKFMDAEPPYRRCVGVLDVEFMTGKLTPEAIKVLMNWMGTYGQEKFYVFADASHPFQNLEVENAGFDVSRVLFQKWKDYGLGNCTKYFTTRNRLFIRTGLTGFIEQLKRYRQDKYGKPVKKDDHSPDAWLCAMLRYPFEDKFREDLEPTEEELNGHSVLPAPTAPGFDGQHHPTISRPNIVVPAIDASIVRPKRSSDGQVVVM